MPRWVCLFPLFVAVAFHGAAFASPIMTGQVAGETRLLDRSTEYRIPWNIEFGRDHDGHGTYICRVDAAGTQVVITGALDPFTGEGSWTINRARIDAATWFSLLGPSLADFLKDASAQGEFLLSGEGVIAHGRASGPIHLEWRDGVLTHPSEGWTLGGVAFNGTFDVDLSSRRIVSMEPFELKIETITHPRFGARKLVVRGALSARHTLTVEQIALEIAGGEMFGDPCEVGLFPLKIDMNLHFQRVGLPDIVLLVPAAGLDEARGSIDGEVRVKWSAASDLQFGLGHLALRADEPTVVRLSPTLGLLTGRVPQYIDLLPGWTGALGRWLRPENPAFADLQRIELGKAELRVSALKVELTPDGDGEGRSAKVRMVARPEETGTSVKEVTVDVNVAGPLNQVLKLGLEQNFSITTR